MGDVIAGVGLVDNDLMWDLVIDWEDTEESIIGTFKSVEDCLEVVKKYNGYRKVTIAGRAFDRPEQF